MKWKTFLLHLFTPQESNNYKARSLHVDFLSFYLIGALVLVFTVKNISVYFNNVLGFATDITISKLFELTNIERSKQSLPLLQYNAALENAAQGKAKDMFAKNYWSHFAPDGTSPWDFILGSGYQYEFAGENLAKNFLFSQGVVDAWMNSPSHRDNILRKDYSEVGYAIMNGVINGEETTLVVQMFGTPLNKTIEVKSQENNYPVTVSKDKVVTKQVPVVLGKKNVNPKINLLPFSFNATSLFIIFFSIVLLADFYIASKLQIVRIGGKHIAHLIFLGFITIAILLIIKNGTIL